MWNNWNPNSNKPNAKTLLLRKSEQYLDIWQYEGLAIYFFKWKIFFFNVMVLWSVILLKDYMTYKSTHTYITQVTESDVWELHNFQGRGCEGVMSYLLKPVMSMTICYTVFYTFECIWNFHNKKMCAYINEINPPKWCGRFL